MTKIVVGLMETAKDAESAVTELTRTCGCERADIGLLARGDDGGLAARAADGLPAEEARYYEEGVKRGGTLVTVHARNDQMAECAASVLRGAVDVEELAAQWKQEGSGGTPGSTQEQGVLPVANEELVVGKREVTKSGVRIYTRVTEVPAEETLGLREEHARIERRRVDGPVEPGAGAFREQTIEVRETAEEPVVAKRARVVEEVIVSKDTTQRQQTVHDTVRKTEVHVEQTGAAARGKRSAGTHGGERRKSSAGYRGVDRRGRSA